MFLLKRKTVRASDSCSKLFFYALFAFQSNSRKYILGFRMTCWYYGINKHHSPPDRWYFCKPIYLVERWAFKLGATTICVCVCACCDGHTHMCVSWCGCRVLRSSKCVVSFSQTGPALLLLLQREPSSLWKHSSMSMVGWETDWKRLQWLFVFC